MSTIFEKDKKFKEAIGAFIIAFSELEYGLAHLGALTEFDLRKRDNYLLTHIGNTFERKVKILTEFIDGNLTELKPIWDELKGEIGQLNRERRFIAHGFNQYFLPNESITTYIKEGKKLSSKELTVDNINKLTNRLHHLNTGENGINGEFHTLFTKTRINKWNELVNDDNKIVYSVNSKIESDWKGKEK